MSNAALMARAQVFCDQLFERAKSLQGLWSEARVIESDGDFVFVYGVDDKGNMARIQQLNNGYALNFIGPTEKRFGPPFATEIVAEKMISHQELAILGNLELIPFELRSFWTTTAGPTRELLAYFNPVDATSDRSAASLFVASGHSPQLSVLFRRGRVDQAEFWRLVKDRTIRRCNPYFSLATAPSSIRCAVVDGHVMARQDDWKKLGDIPVEQLKIDS